LRGTQRLRTRQARMCGGGNDKIDRENSAEFSGTHEFSDPACAPKSERVALSLRCARDRSHDRFDAPLMVTGVEALIARR